MNRVPHMDPYLKLYGIDQVVVVPKNKKINQKQLSTWTQKQIKTSIIQSEKDFNLSFVKEQLKRDLEESKIARERTMLISDFPEVISTQKGKKLAMILGLNDEELEYKSLYDSGADLVVNSLQDIDLIEGNASSTTFTQTLISAFEKLSNFKPGLSIHRPLFIFDYDGTLVPITRDPAKAYLPEENRKLLAQMANKYRVAIISGRDMNDLKNFIGIDSLIYAGSHGFRISGPGDLTMRHEKEIEISPSIKWHKGKAVEWILHALEQEDGQTYQPVYLGDDITDEDAFRSIAGHGIGILVGRHSAPSAACCHLSNVGEVEKLLHFLVHDC